MHIQVRSNTINEKINPELSRSMQVLYILFKKQRHYFKWLMDGWMF